MCLSVCVVFVVQMIIDSNRQLAFQVDASKCVGFYRFFDFCFVINRALKWVLTWKR